MSELFVHCTEMSETKFMTTKRSDAAVRLRGRNRKTGFGENDRIIKFQETHKGGENHGHKNHAKAVKADQCTHQKALLQLCGRQLPSAGRRRGARLRAVHQPVRDLLQLFQKCSPSRRQGTVCRDHAAKPTDTKYITAPKTAHRIKRKRCNPPHIGLHHLLYFLLPY